MGDCRRLLRHTRQSAIGNRPSALLSASCLLFCLVLAGCAAPEAGLPVSPRSPGAALVERLPIPPLQLTIPRLGREVERRVLRNGIVLYLASDRSLPVLDVSVLVRAGSLYEDPARPGVASFTASQLRNGGTAARDSAAMNEELETLGLSIEASAGTEVLSLTLNALAKDAEVGLALLAEMLRRPAFDPQPLETARGRVIEDLRRVVENPSRLAAREFARQMYTEAYPLGRPLTPAQARAIQRDDLVRHHRRLVRPDNILVAAVGDFSPDELADKIQRHLGGWTPDGPLDLPPLPAVVPRFERAAYVLHRDLGQASLLLGHFGINRANPDRYAIDLLDFILGGSGFTSRITERVRSEEGLAYSAWATFPTTTRDIGIFRASVQTKNENVPRAVQVILEEMARLQREPVSPRELARAKEATVNSFVFQFPSRASTVLQLLMLEFDDQPPTFYETLLDRYRAVTVEDIQRVARQYLHPEATTVLVVGDVHRLETALSAFGPVRRLSLPEPE